MNCGLSARGVESQRLRCTGDAGVDERQAVGMGQSRQAGSPRVERQSEAGVGACHDGYGRPCGVGTGVGGAQRIRADDGDGIESLPVTPADRLEPVVLEPVAGHEVLMSQFRSESRPEDVEGRLGGIGFDSHARDGSIRLDSVDEPQGSHAHRITARILLVQEGQNALWKRRGRPQPHNA